MEHFQHYSHSCLLSGYQEWAQTSQLVEHTYSLSYHHGSLFEVDEFVMLNLYSQVVIVLQVKLSYVFIPSHIVDVLPYFDHFPPLSSVTLQYVGSCVHYSLS